MKYEESETVELKRELNKDFAKEIVAFLNTRDGTIYIGVKDNGEVIGVNNVDKTMRETTNIVHDQILPSTDGLYKIGSSMEGDKCIVYLKVFKGNKLYYIKKEGRSATGCFYRDGTTSPAMNEDEIERRFRETIKIERLPINEIVSTSKDLTFEIFKVKLLSKGVHINEKRFLDIYRLLAPNGKYNLLADLVSDENGVSLAVCTFKGNNKENYDKRNEYGGRSILESYKDVINYCESLNDTYIDVSSRPRKEKRMFVNAAFEEAWINACVHNRWDTGISPQVYLFDDRMEIVSEGGIPEGMSKDDFLEGVSRPVNPALMDIFKACGIVERSGHGVPEVVKAYGKEAYKFAEGRITVTIPFDKTGFNTDSNQNSIENLTKTEKEVLEIISKDSNVTSSSLASALGISGRMAQKYLRSLKDKGIIERIGSDKTGHWSVVKKG